MPFRFLKRESLNSGLGLINFNFVSTHELAQKMIKSHIDSKVIESHTNSKWQNHIYILEQQLHTQPSIQISNQFEFFYWSTSMEGSLV